MKSILEQFNGPWRAEGWNALVVNDATGNTLALYPGCGGSVDAIKANARLIAAAPELLSACAFAAAILSQNYAYPDEMDKARQALEVAVAKARE